jgi:hypothetical protein
VAVLRHFKVLPSPLVRKKIMFFGTFFHTKQASSFKQKQFFLKTIGVSPQTFGVFPEKYRSCSNQKSLLYVQEIIGFFWKNTLFFQKTQLYFDKEKLQFLQKNTGVFQRKNCSFP